MYCPPTYIIFNNLYEEYIRRDPIRRIQTDQGCKGLVHQIYPEYVSSAYVWIMIKKMIKKLNMF